MYCYSAAVILKERNIKIATEVEPWPRAVRRASINSFGYGGANGHLVLESVESYLGQDPYCFAGSLVGPNSTSIENKTHGDAAIRANGNGHANGNGTHTNGNGHANGLHDNSAHEETNGSLPSTKDQKAAQKKSFLLPVFASSNYSLKALVQQVSEAASRCNDPSELESMAFTLSNGRDHLRKRSYVVAELDNSSAKAVAVTPEAEAVSASSTAIDPHPFAFVFTGQGAQSAGMAKELLWTSPDFQATIQRLDKVLQALPPPYAPSWTLEQTLLDEPAVSRINEVTRSQSACTAVQIALVDLLRTWGIKPASTVGHSSGEIAAAYAAGLLSATQAILVAHFRGYAVNQLKAQSRGQMAAAGLSPDAASALIESRGLQSQVRVACVNSPESVTLSGTLEAVEALIAELQDQKKFVRKLATDRRAYHSHLMQEIGQLYEDLLTPVLEDNEGAGISKKDHIRMFSSVGHSPDNLAIIDSPGAVGPRYWRRNLEQPVQFSEALATLASQGQGTNVVPTQLLEIGPNSALKGPIQQIRKALGRDERTLSYLPTLVRNEDADICIKTLAGALFARGYDVALDRVNNLHTSANLFKPLADLPRYPWDYTGGILWSEPRPSAELRNRKYMRHELLGTAALAGNGIDFAWRNVLKPNEMPWVQDHKLEDQVVFPAAGYIAMAIEAVAQVTEIKQQLRDGTAKAALELQHVHINAALAVPEENNMKDLELHTAMSLRKTSGTGTSSSWYDFSISSVLWTTGQTTLHCTGSIRVVYNPSKADMNLYTTNVSDAASFDLWQSMAKWYAKWHSEGLCFGPRFQSLTSLRTDSSRRRKEAIATARLAPPLPLDVKEFEEFYPVHPITIDAGLQAACLSGTAGHVASLKTWLPVYVDQCYILPPSLTNATDRNEGEIHVTSEEMGFSSRRIDGVCNNPISPNPLVKSMCAYSSASANPKPFFLCCRRFEMAPGSSLSASRIHVSLFIRARLPHRLSPNISSKQPKRLQSTPPAPATLRWTCTSSVSPFSKSKSVETLLSRVFLWLNYRETNMLSSGNRISYA